MFVFVGSSIERLCEITATDPLGYPPPDGPLSDRSAMIRAARALLSSVTRVLLLADIVVVKQLLLAKDRVARSLCRMEQVANFTEFVKAFSVFGAEMVELAHVTGKAITTSFSFFLKAYLDTFKRFIDRLKKLERNLKLKIKLIVIHVKFQ